MSGTLTLLKFPPALISTARYWRVSMWFGLCLAGVRSRVRGCCRHWSERRLCVSRDDAYRHRIVISPLKGETLPHRALAPTAVPPRADTDGTFTEPTPDTRQPSF